MANAGNAAAILDQLTQTPHQVDVNDLTIFNTTSTTAVTAGSATNIVVSSATGIVAGDWMAVDSGANFELMQVSAVAGTTITPATNWAHSHSGTYGIVQIVARQIFSLGDPAIRAAIAAVLNTYVAGTEYGLVTRNIEPFYTPSFTLTNAIGTTKTLVSANPCGLFEVVRNSVVNAGTSEWINCWNVASTGAATGNPDFRIGPMASSQVITFRRKFSVGLVVQANSAVCATDPNPTYGGIDFHIV